MRPGYWIVLVSCVVLTGAARAQSDSCDPNDDSQTMMSLCAAQDYQAADAKLNDIYKQVASSLASDAKSLQLLKTAERAWIAYRDAECAFATADSAGGSIQPMLISQCLTRLTNERIGALKSDGGCDSNGSCDQSEGNSQDDDVTFGDQ